MSKVRGVNVRKDDTKKMEDETRRMEAKLEMLRRTLDAPEPEKKSGGADAGRWRSGSSSKPLTKGYVKNVLDTKSGGKPKASGSSQKAPVEASSQQKASAAPAASAANRTLLSELGPSTKEAVAAEGRSGSAGPASPAAQPAAGAAANLQAHMQQQSQDALEVEAFLAELKLDRYVSLFMEHGFDCMEVVREMQESHMRDIGMAPGHALKLRKRLAELDAPPNRGAAMRQVSFGATEEVPLRPAEASAPPRPSSTQEAPHRPSSGGSGRLMDGGFNEEESAASFQEALRAWRQGTKAGASQGGSQGGSSQGSSQGGSQASSTPKAGSFWSNIGDSEMDLSRCSTPVKPPSEPALDRGEKLCCYHCFKQFYAKYAVERECPLPETGGNKVKRLCSEACADTWVRTMEAKAEELRQRQEKLDKMQAMQQALDAERHTGAATQEPAERSLEDPTKLTFAVGGAVDKPLNVVMSC
mmetsp:Transcript_93274/g.216806  ORF Transcript_93274/g.216806 Transcript_93274/m.216806 type:complete len:471 (+) Transcript_93274:108-1520(+)